MKLVRSLAFLLLVVVSSSGESIVYVRVHRPLIEEQLKLAPATDADRVNMLRTLFQKGECPQIVDQQLPAQPVPNVMCIMPGQEQGTIVVAASIADSAEHGEAHWSTLTLLPLLVESIALVPHRFYDRADRIHKIAGSECGCGLVFGASHRGPAQVDSRVCGC